MGSVYQIHKGARGELPLKCALLDDQTLRALKLKKAEPKQLNRLADILRDDPSVIAPLGGRVDLRDALSGSR